MSRRIAGRFDAIEFRREFDRKNGRVTGRFDASVMGLDPDPDSSFYHFGDPSGDPLVAPLTSAAVDLTTRKLNWRPDGSYELLNAAVEKGWNFGRGINPAESISDLRKILATDPKLKLLVGHGLFDLATPYVRSIQILLDQLPAFASPPPGQNCRLSRRPHVLFAHALSARRSAPKAEEGRNEVSAREAGAIRRPAPAQSGVAGFSRRGRLPGGFSAGRRPAGDIPRFCRYRRARAADGIA